MSYFCANSISIDRNSNTCKVKGGDNNVVPRSNEWSHYFPLRGLIVDVSSGCIQFTTRSERNLLVEQLAFEANKQIIDLTGLSAYELSAIIRANDDMETVEQRHLESLAYYQSNDIGTSDDYNRDQIIELQNILDVIHDNEMMLTIEQIVQDFITKVTTPQRQAGKFILQTISGGYISRVRRSYASTTTFKEYAMTFSEAKAKDIMSRYSNLTLLPASSN